MKFPFTFAYIYPMECYQKSIVVHCKIIIDLLPEKCEPKRERND